MHTQVTDLVNMDTNAEALKSLTLFKRQYLQLVDPKELKWPTKPSVSLAADWVQVWLFDNLFDENRVRFRPPERYQLRVLKELVSRVEDAIDDADEEVGEPSGCELLPDRPSSSLQYTLCINVHVKYCQHKK